MIEQSKYVPQQMNGPIINSVFKAIEEELSDADEVIKYIKGLSIRTAQETELETIGCLIGYPRPLVPEGFNAENVMLLGSLPLLQDELIGLSQVDSEIGGRLSSVETSDSFYMNLGVYRRILANIAKIKRYGITIKCIDDIASAISKNYTITWDEYGDINVNFQDNIGYKNVWLLTQLFFRICTAPQVLILAGE